MLFVIFCLDRPGSLQTRLDNIEAHKDYLAGEPIKVVMSGPLVSDDGAAPVGSLFLVDADDRAQVEASQRNDPLYQAGIWETVEIRAFDKRSG